MNWTLWRLGRKKAITPRDQREIELQKVLSQLFQHGMKLSDLRRTLADMDDIPIWLYETLAHEDRRVDQLMQHLRDLMRIPYKKDKPPPTPLPPIEFSLDDLVDMYEDDANG